MKESVKHELPAYMSLLFFPIGLFLSWRLHSKQKTNMVLGLLILMLLLANCISRNPSISIFLYMVLALNVTAAIFLFGLHVSGQSGETSCVLLSNAAYTRWVFSPTLTFGLLYGIILLCRAAENDGRGGFSLDAVLEYLMGNEFLSLLLTSWLILMFITYLQSGRRVKIGMHQRH